VDVIAPGAPNGRRRTPIKVGVGNGTKIEVLEGLRPGEKLLLPG
jgi:multidrug efflux pump subunit AcrA (membrane-fusion protein)